MKQDKPIKKVDCLADILVFLLWRIESQHYRVGKRNLRLRVVHIVHIVNVVNLKSFYGHIYENIINVEKDIISQQ